MTDVEVITRIRLIQLDPPTDPLLIADWHKGERMIQLGYQLPIPWLRPWLRKRGAALKKKVGTHREISVGITDWKHEPLYSEVVVLAPSRGIELSWWERTKLKTRWTLRETKWWLIDKLHLWNLEERLSWWRYVVFRWLAEKGVW